MNVDIAVSILLVVINLEIIVLYIATDDELQQCVIFVSDGSQTETASEGKVDDDAIDSKIDTAIEGEV